MATIREYFETAFPHTIRLRRQVEVGGSRERTIVQVRVHVDFAAHARFLSLLVESNPADDLCAVLEALVSGAAELLEPHGVTEVTLPNLPAHDTRARLKARVDESNVTSLAYTGTDGASFESDDLPFTGRIYLFSEQGIPDEMRQRVQRCATLAGTHASFRDPDFAGRVDKMLTPRAFISHDSRDKAEIARPLADALSGAGIPVWYDEYSLKVGDSLRDGIERGLKTCASCILVLTPNFLSKGGWAKREYDSAFTKEIVEDRRVFLPIWSGVSRDAVYEYSPILADRVGVSWTLGLDEVCRRLRRALEEPTA